MCHSLRRLAGTSAVAVAATAVAAVAAAAAAALLLQLPCGETLAVNRTCSIKLSRTSCSMSRGVMVGIGHFWLGQDRMQELFVPYY